MVVIVGAGAPRGSDENALTDDPASRHFGAFGRATQAMPLLASAVVELNDDYALDEDMKLTLKPGTAHQRRLNHRRQPPR